MVLLAAFKLGAAFCQTALLASCCHAASLCRWKLGGLRGCRGDVDDRVLLEAMLPLLEKLSASPDVRPVLHARFDMQRWFSSQVRPASTGGRPAAAGDLPAHWVACLSACFEVCLPSIGHSLAHMLSSTRQTSIPDSGHHFSGGCALTKFFHPKAWVRLQKTEFQHT